jgi:hypothetical protein
MAFAVVTAIASCTSPEHLPSYAHRYSDGTVLIDVGEASGGSAELEQRSAPFVGQAIVTRFDGYETEFA